MNPQFQRTSTALNNAMVVECLSDKQMARLAAKTIDPPQARKFYLIGTGVTSRPRPYAETVPDRGFVYQPNMIKGNKPIAIGHQFSFVAALPERDKTKMGPWVIVLPARQTKNWLVLNKSEPYWKMTDYSYPNLPSIPHILRSCFCSPPILFFDL